MDNPLAAEHTYVAPHNVALESLQQRLADLPTDLVLDEPSTPLPTTLGDIIDQCLQDSEAWFKDVADDPGFMALALAGEVGEVCNVIKKAIRGSLTPEEAAPLVEEELVDSFIYLMNLVGLFQRDDGFDLVEAYHKKRAFNVARFEKPAEKFDGERYNGE